MKSQQVLDELGKILNGVEELRVLVKEECKEKEKKEKSIREKVEKIVFSVHYSNHNRGADLIEELVREELEAAAVALERAGLEGGWAPEIIRERLNQ